MKPVWGDLNARVRGLATHLLSRSELRALARLPDLPAVATALARRGFPIAEETAVPAAIELALQHQVAGQLAVLGRWAGPRSAVLSVLFDDEDRRSVRAIIRGIAGPDSTETRWSGLVPTPSLPLRALQELGRQPSVGKVAAILSAWGHPYGPPLSAVRGPEPDLLDCEIRVNRAFAARALKGALRDGPRGTLVKYVREVIDVENAFSALVLSSGSGEGLVDVFVEGGAVLRRSRFEGVLALKDPSAAAARIGQVFTDTGLSGAFATVQSGGDLERAVLGAQIGELRRRSLLHPLGPAPILRYGLQLRAQLMDLRGLVWGIALGAAPASLADALVTSA